MKEIDKHYTEFYKVRRYRNVYPTEFVVRTFLANYPKLTIRKAQPGDKILDVGFGDGRNTLFLCQQGFDVCGIEITQEIVDQTTERINSFGYKCDLRVGRNSTIPFEDATFDYILASHSCYYCDEGETIADNLKEYSRVLKREGWLIASVVHTASYIFANAQKLADGTMRITSDPYNNRNGYRLMGFGTTDDIEAVFSAYFYNFSFGQAHNNYYGIDENVYWVVCQKK
jgi:ubiquinone/menaquinone biosynthesis C-methylase UbiE